MKMVPPGVVIHISQHIEDCGRGKKAGSKRTIVKAALRALALALGAGDAVAEAAADVEAGGDCVEATLCALLVLACSRLGVCRATVVLKHRDEGSSTLAGPACCDDLAAAAKDGHRKPRAKRRDMVGDV